MGITVNELDVVLKAQTGQYEQGIRKAASSTSTFGRSAGKSFALVTAAVQGLGFLIGKVINQIGASIKGAIKQRKAFLGLAQGLRNTGDATKETLNEFKSLTAELQAKTGVGDELQFQAARVLTTFKLSGKEIQAALPALLDIQAVVGDMDGDLTSLANQFGKVLAEPEKFASSMARQGIIINKELLKGKTIEQQRAIILKEIKEQYGGQAEAINKATFGIANLKATIGDLQETFGEGLLEGLEPFIKGLQAILNSGDGFKKFGLVVGKSVAIIGQIALVAVQGISQLINAFKEAQAIISGKSKGNVLQLQKELLKVQEDYFKFEQGNKGVSGDKKIGSLSKEGEITVRTVKQVREAFINKINIMTKEQDKLLGKMNGKVNSSAESLRLLNEMIKDFGNDPSDGDVLDLFDSVSDKTIKINENVSDLNEEIKEVEYSADELLGIFADLASEMLGGNKEAKILVDTISGLLKSIVTGNVLGIITTLISGIVSYFSSLQDSTDEVADQVGLWESLKDNISLVNDKLTATSALMSAFRGDEEQILRLTEKQLKIYEKQNKLLVSRLQIDKGAAQKNIDYLQRLNKLSQGNIEYLESINILGVNNKNIRAIKREIKARETLIEQNQKLLDSAAGITEATELNADGTIKNLEAFEKLLDAENDPDRRSVLQEILDNNNLILDSKEKELEVEETINDAIKERIRLTRELAGFVDVQNVSRQRQIENELRASGLSGSALNTELQSAGVVGGSVGDSIGTIINSYYITTADNIADAND